MNSAYEISVAILEMNASDTDNAMAACGLSHWITDSIRSKDAEQFETANRAVEKYREKMIESMMKWDLISEGTLTRTGIAFKEQNYADQEANFVALDVCASAFDFLATQGLQKPDEIAIFRSCVVKTLIASAGGKLCPDVVQLCREIVEATLVPGKFASDIRRLAQWVTSHAN